MTIFSREFLKMFQSDWLILRITRQPLKKNDPNITTQRSWFIYNKWMKVDKKENKNTRELERITFWL